MGKPPHRAEPSSGTPVIKWVNNCAIQRIEDPANFDYEKKYVVYFPKGWRRAGYGTTMAYTKTIRVAEWIARHDLEEGPPQ